MVFDRIMDGLRLREGECVCVSGCSLEGDGRIHLTRRDPITISRKRWKIPLDCSTPRSLYRRSRWSARSHLFFEVAKSVISLSLSRQHSDSPIYRGVVRLLQVAAAATSASLREIFEKVCIKSWSGTWPQFCNFFVLFPTSDINCFLGRPRLAHRAALDWLV